MTSQDHADWLDACSGGLALAAAVRVRDEPDAGTRGDTETWKEHFRRSLGELSAAMRLGRPGLFADHIRWLRAGCLARNGDADELAHGLRCLSQTLKEELPVPHREPISEVVQEGLRQLEGDAADWRNSLLDPADPLQRRALEYLLALMEGDRQRAADPLVKAVEQGELNVRAAYCDVLAPALREVGRMWWGGEASVAEEHFATLVTQNVLARLAPLAERKAPHGHTVVTASVQGCAHDLATRMLADFFEFEGWRAIPLGADVPPADLVAAARHFDATVIALSATLTTHWSAVQDTVRALRQESPDRWRILVGGGVAQYASGQGLDGVDAVGVDLHDAVRIAGEWVTPA